MDIYVNGQLTRQDIIRAFFRHLEPTRNSIAIRLALLGFIVLVLIFSYYRNTATWWTYLLAVVVVIGILSPWWMPYFQAFRFNKNSPLLKPLTGVVTGEGVSLRGYRFNSNLKWSSFTHYKRTRAVVLLYQGPNAFNFLSRNLFNSGAEWEECVSIVEKLLPSN
jgi:hypothetical protein